MGDLAQNISEAAETLQNIERESRRRRDERDMYATVAYVPSAAMLRLRERAWIEARWPIAWPTWPPGLRAKGAALFQKVLRRLLSWYVEPIVRQQNEFNRAALQVLDELSNQIADLKASQLRVRGEQARQLDLLQNKVAGLERQTQGRKP